MVVYDAVRVACGSCVSVGVCVCVCVCVCISYVSGVCLSWSVRLFGCVVHCCVDDVGVFVGMSVRDDIRVYPCGCQSIYDAFGCVFGSASSSVSLLLYVGVG